MNLDRNIENCIISATSIMCYLQLCVERCSFTSALTTCLMGEILPMEKMTAPTPLMFTVGANWRERGRLSGTAQVLVCWSRFVCVCLCVSVKTEIQSFPHVSPSGALVLRVPVLFGEVESVTESAVTSLWLKVEASESCTLDHCQQRFPTDARDVATVCRKLAERAGQVRQGNLIPGLCPNLSLLLSVSLHTSL